jgi:hypothetical protein
MKRTTRSQLREGDRSWEGRLWENCQTMNKKLIRGRLSGMRWHNTPKSRHLAQEVNGTFGQWRITQLPGEISPTRGRACATARPLEIADVIGEKSAEVILAGNANRSARLHSKVAAHAPVKDRTKTMKRPEHPSTTTKPQGEVRHGYGTQAEKETSCVQTGFPKGNSAHVRHLRMI